MTALNKFVTYRTRGGPAVQDAFFSPTTQTPYTDDLQFGYGVDLGNNMSFDALYFNRRSRDILEDYDLELYADPNGYPGPDQRSELAVPRLRLLRLHREPRLELRHRHARRRRAQLPRPRVRVPQALRQQLAAAGVVQLARRQGQHQLRLERRLPGRRDLPRSARAEPVRDAARPDPAPDQGRRLVHVRLRPAAGRHVLAGTRARSPAGRSCRRAATCRSASARPRRSSSPASPTAGWRRPVGSLENPAWGQVDLRAQYNRRISGRRRTPSSSSTCSTSRTTSRRFATRIWSPAPAATRSATRSCG